MSSQLGLLFSLWLITCQSGIAGTANHAVPVGSDKRTISVSQKSVAATQSATTQNRISRSEGWGKPPKSRLLAAIRGGNIGKVKALLAHISNLDRAYDHLTPLMQAVIARQPEVTRLLLEHGASPDYAPEGDYTPLTAAAYGNDKEIVEILISAGANVNNGGKTDEQPLLDASASARDNSVLQELIAARSGHSRGGPRRE